MPDIYKKIIANAVDAISNASDRELQLDRFNEKVFNLSSIKIPKLNLEHTKVQIKSEEISFRNAPPGISFSMSGGRLVEYAIYTIPISGDLELFGNLAKPFIDGRTTYVEYNVLNY